MIPYEFGDVLLIQFPFTDVTAGKRRPALVIADTGDDDVLVARITRATATSKYDAPITDWSQAGLVAPSIVRLHKLASLEKSLIVRKLGSLSDNDCAQACEALKQLLAIVHQRLAGDRKKGEPEGDLPGTSSQ